MKRIERTWQKVISLVVMLISNIGMIGFASYQYGCSFRTIFLLSMVSLACYIVTVFSLFQSMLHHKLNFDNQNHFVRFAVIYEIGLLASIIFPLLPQNSWVFPVLALALTLFSNTITGMLAYTQMLSICAVLSNADLFLVIVYLLTGMIFVIVFEQLDHEFKMGLPIVITTLIYSVCIIGYSVFIFANHWTYEMIFIPIVNICITLILVLAVLRFICAVIIDREKGEYIDINDQEFELLAKYKEENIDLYYNAIHTAYFAEKIARARKMDIDLAKNGGYYHRIIASECKAQNKSLEEICDYYDFPEKAVTLLQEINYKSKNITMKETAVVYLTEAAISSVLYLMKKEDNKEVDYGKVAAAVMKRRIENGALKNCEISLADLEEMEKIFVGEKLYYDFLRRE